jgi:hypothetical protein
VPKGIDRGGKQGDHRNLAQSRKEDMTRTVRVRDLEKGDVLVFGDIRRTVKHIGQSSVDPVYLIQLEETDEAIAKAPKDLVTVEV